MISLVKRHLPIAAGLLAIAAAVALAVVLVSGRAGKPGGGSASQLSTREGAVGSAQGTVASSTQEATATRTRVAAASTATAVSTPIGLIDPAGPGPVFTEEPVYATMQAYARSQPQAPKVHDPPPPQVLTAAEMTAVKSRAGIYTADADEQYHNSPLIEVENLWVDVVDGRRVQVTVGAPDDDPSQGVVIVRTSSLTGTDAESGVYYTPTKSGAVKVTAASGAEVTLQAANGAVYIFDVRTRTFTRK